MFIGSLSAYLTIAHAVHDVPHIVGLSDCQDEINRMSNLQKYIQSIMWHPPWTLYNKCRKQYERLNTVNHIYNEGVVYKP